MKKIIVPVDFTDVSKAALKYAMDFAAAIGSDLSILHLVEDRKDAVDRETKLVEFAQDLGLSDPSKVNFLVVAGSIFSDIGKIAEVEKADLIIMGTHGIKGMQLIRGSHALRIIRECTVPVIIVQENNSCTAYPDGILVPLDLHKDTKQKLKIAADFSEQFNAVAHVISPNETDEYLNNTINRNLSYAVNYLEERGVAFEASITEEDSGEFVKGLIKYASEKGVDLICILNNTNETFFHAFGLESEQKIITNDAGIPVLIMNPAAAMVDSASVFAQ
jgi:nucleotide-binding universal stress UspA family protein